LTVECRDARNLIHPFVDGELDLIRHLQLEHHLADCSECAGREQGVRQVSEALAVPALHYRAPDTLRSKIETAYTQPAYPATLSPARPKPRKTSVLVATAAGVLLLAATAVTAGFLLARPDAEERLAEQVVAGHVRSLQVAHATDVPSSDRHTVKPWFLGKVDFSPNVPDLSSRDYVLTGGRLDYLVDHPVAALVYRRRDHLINVFTWAASDENERPVRSLRRQGFQMRQWQQSGMIYWAISDLNPQELDEFVHLLRESSIAPPLSR
jgi:anti-sigma factor RsiW